MNACNFCGEVANLVRGSCRACYSKEDLFSTALALQSSLEDLRFEMMAMEERHDV